MKLLSTIKEAGKQPVNRERSIIDLPFEWGVNRKFVKWATGWAKKYAHQQESIESEKECEYSPVECAKNV